MVLHEVYIAHSYTAYMDELLSIVIPYYEGEAYIQDTIRGINRQTYSNIEVVVVDDGSNEKSIDELKNALENLDHPNTLVRHEENLGISAARNSGVEAANGEYIAIHDQDDISLPTRFERQIDVMRNDSDIGTVLTNVCHIGSGQHRVRSFEKGLDKMTTEDFIRHMFESWVERESPLPITTEMTRAEVYENVGNYDTSYYGCNDQEFLYRVASKYEIRGLDEPLVKRRFHGENASTADFRLLEDERAMTESVTNLFPEFKGAKASKRDAFYFLVESRKRFNQNERKIALQRYAQAFRTDPMFTIKRTLRFPIKRLRSEIN